jgi:hypothetical protein
MQKHLATTCMRTIHENAEPTHQNALRGVTRLAGTPFSTACAASSDAFDASLCTQTHQVRLCAAGVKKSGSQS